MQAALAHIPVAAFWVSTKQVLAANRLGHEWLGANRANRAFLMRRAGPDPNRFDVTAVPSGASIQYLAVLRSGAEALPATGIARWNLTPRENEVLGLLLRGEANRQIATELGCAMKTVEHHVTSILRKANVESRVCLIVAILGP